MTLPDVKNDELLATISQMQGLIVVSGIFNGDIHNGTHVYVTPSGYINGCIYAKNIIIAGKVKGNVEADNLKVLVTGKLYFDIINYNNLDIEDGGLLIKNHFLTSNGLKQYNVRVKQSVSIQNDENDLISNEPVHFKSSF